MWNHRRITHTLTLSLPFCLLVFGGTAYAQWGKDKIIEYVDNEYNYAFQFPSDWEMVKVPTGNEFGEVRVMVKSPGGGYVMVVIGNTGKNVTKEAFNNNPNRNAIVEQLIELTIEQVYKKTSRDVNATRMVVTERNFIPSEVGIKFYISTTHFLARGIPVLVAGIHVVPFGREYIVGFIMFSIVDRSTKEGNETLTRVFNSFHIIGEQPIDNP